VRAPGCVGVSLPVSSSACLHVHTLTQTHTHTNPSIYHTLGLLKDSAPCTCVVDVLELYHICIELCTSSYTSFSLMVASHLHRICIELCTNAMQIRCKCDATINGKRRRIASNLHRNAKEIRCKSDANYDTNAMQI